MARTQTLVQLTDELLALLDQRAAKEGVSRSDLVRRALDQFLSSDRDAAIDAAIVAGYLRHPAEPVDQLTLRLATASIEEEPW